MNGSNVLLRFDLSTITPATSVTSATLRLYSHTQYGNTTLVAGVFRCAQGETVTSAAPIGGLAAEYTDDQGIENHPDVVFATGFEADNWEDVWTSTSGTIDIVSTDTPRSFVALHGKALRARIPEGENSSMSVIYKFADKIGKEPEKIYFRYYLRFADDWNQSVSGGKLPGISGTYGRAGWVGRKPDGTDGWSARGTYYLSISGNNPLTGTHPIGTYCYYADQPGTYGDSWPWNKEYKGFLEKNRWHCIEQYVQMNTPGGNTTALSGPGWTAVCSGSGTCNDTTTVSGDTLAQINDFTYLGAFRIASDDFGVSNTNYAIGTLAYNPDRNSIFIAGHDHHRAIAEFSIPDLVISDDLLALDVVESPLQEFVYLLDSSPNGNPEGLTRITGLLYIDGQLIINVENWYDAGGANRDTTLIVRTANNLSTSEVNGYFELGGGRLGRRDTWHKFQNNGGRALAGLT